MLTPNFLPQYYNLGPAKRASQAALALGIKPEGTSPDVAALHRASVRARQHFRLALTMI